MKIYFSAAIESQTTKREYEQTTHFLKELGHTIVLDTTKIIIPNVSSKTEEQRSDYYEQILEGLQEADLAVFEVSFPSTLHIGHEISLALQRGKPIIALYKIGHEPSFFLGLKEEKLLWLEYEEETLKDTLIHALSYISEQVNVRFNLFLSSRLSTYLEVVCESEKISKSKFIRDLITNHMKQTI